MKQFLVTRMSKGDARSAVLTGLALAGYALLFILLISLYVLPVQRWWQAMLVG